MNANTGIRRSRIRPRGARFRPGPDGPRFQIRLAELEDERLVIGLIEQAAAWLRHEKDTDQWNRPWPDEERRDKRVLEGVTDRRTWILWDGDRAIASVTINLLGSPDLWNEEELREEAIYIHRLVIDREYAGTGLGAELIRWAELEGRRQAPNARLLRIDVWTDNHELHDYYRRQGFRKVGERVTHDDCPSGALFQKRIRRPSRHDTPRIVTAGAPRPVPAGREVLGGLREWWHNGRIARTPAHAAVNSASFIAGTLTGTVMTMLAMLLKVG